MSCVFFVIGLILAALDLYIDTMDILVDAAGFVVILFSLLPLLVQRQFPLPHLIWPLGALLCSILLWIPENSLRLLCTIAQNFAFGSYFGHWDDACFLTARRVPPNAFSIRATLRQTCF